MKTKFRLRHLALDSICRNLSRRAASLTDLASKVARHAFEVQRFARNCAVVFDDRSGKLMSEVGATVADLLVFMRRRATRLCPIRAALLFAGKPPLSAFDLAFSSSEASHCHWRREAKLIVRPPNRSHFNRFSIDGVAALISDCRLLWLNFHLVAKPL